MKRAAFVLAAAVCLCAVLSACSQNGSAGDPDGTAPGPERFVSVAADSEGLVVIPVSGITESATFYNYDADGVTVQLVAVRDDNGGPHIAFNTCQSCSPSPKAYYTQTDGKLRCESCGFTFSAEYVGCVHGGCSPWRIEDVYFDGDFFTIPADRIESMRSRFVSWNGPVNSVAAE